MRILYLVLLWVFAMSGCGQTGPLYLPVQKPTAPKPEILITPDPQRPLPPLSLPPPE